VQHRWDDHPGTVAYLFLFYAFELYVYLAIDQPDDQKDRLSTGEDCLSLKFLNSIGKLNDAPCTYSAQGYICEQHSMSL